MNTPVKIRAFPVTMTTEEALALARKKGSPLGKLFLMGKTVHEIRLQFVEHSVLIFEAIHSPNFVSRHFFGDRGEKTQLCRVIANGSSGGVAWAEDLPDKMEEVAVSSDLIQEGFFSMDQLAGKGQKLVLRVLRRRIGGMPEIKLRENYPVYRPFYVALYDAPIEGTKIHYLPIAADGWGTYRTF